MGDMGDLFNASRKATKAHRAEMLAAADTEGWRQHTLWHYSRFFGGHRFDWWPSGGKAQWKDRMVYGHTKVNKLIAELKAEEARHG